MEQKYLNSDVLEQIKDFDSKYYNLSEEQNLLVDKLILNEKLKKRYKYYGLCETCRQPKTGDDWCRPCKAIHFQRNFENWTSGNYVVDEFIQESQLNAKNENEKLEWIEYNRFEKIDYITKGGFGTIYKAIWKDGKFESNKWVRDRDRKKGFVALKSLNNSKDITLEFLNEIKFHLKMNHSENIIHFYGITKNKTGDFMMVMEYAFNGNLRQSLNKDFNSLSWKDKLIISYKIACGLNDIHKKELTHQDFHSGNILVIRNNDNDETFHSITDLGLCKPANEKSEKCKKNVYGVLPYVAPELLRGKKYTQKSDIYSFGIIIYEIFNGLPPYYDMAHEEFLAIRICQGLRPSFRFKVPQLIVDLFNQCVDADPSKRPTAEYLSETFDHWNVEYWRMDSEISKQIGADGFSEEQQSFTKSSISSTELIYTTHPQAIYTSRLLNFNNLPEPKNACDEVEYSDSTKIDFTKLNINSQEKTDEKVIYVEDLEKRVVFGICGECSEPGTEEKWYKPCNAKRFKDNFKNWTNGNKNIDEFIQQSQLDAVHYKMVFEWIPYKNFQNITFITRGGFVALKSLNDSSDISTEFLNDVNK
ncbi:kinase-like domain-containing protein [Glomus cerebriforme]|uniref:Kinase-like domain-containing protein n=1 Tax=Glomus cerebriforme TaxID=658196 RepID=A0A397TDF4_9GLOM|nr:kinase-like domain-containing protein [Glomus cerebriforme]